MRLELLEQELLLAVVHQLDGRENAGLVATSPADRFSACTSLGKHEPP